MGFTVSSANKTNRHDITEILLKVELNTIALNICYRTLIQDIQGTHHLIFNEGYFVSQSQNKIFKQNKY